MCSCMLAVVDMAQAMVSMATPVVAGLGGSALTARRTAAKVQLTSGKTPSSVAEYYICVVTHDHFRSFSHS